MTPTKLELYKQALLLAVTAPFNRTDEANKLAHYFRSLCTHEEAEEAKKFVEEILL
tara:strand:- start:561 stop:728 length:168 start_codon:yes stop_codon:yes gene_type:complete